MRACIAALVLVMGSSSAFAQTRTPAKPAVTVTPIESHWIVVPEAKLTDLDGELGTLVGFTAGWLQDDTLFIGGAGYWLTGGASNWDLAYGGVVLGMQWRGDRAVTFGARGLVGAGEATRTIAVQQYSPFRGSGPWPMNRVTGSWQYPNVFPFPFPDMRDVHMEISNTFFVFEPQASVTFAVTRRIRFGVSGGYRLTTGAEGFRHDIDGATGTLSVQFGLGK